MKITHDDVRHVARLCRLELSGPELELFTHQLDAIVAYVTQLEQLDAPLDGSEAPDSETELTCPDREDEEAPSLDRELLLSQAPAHDGEHFLVPRIIE